MILSYKLKKLIKILTEEAKDLDAYRMDLIKIFAEKDENGELITKDDKVSIPPENIVNFNKQITELFNIEIDINWSKINISELENLNLSTVDLMNIDSIINEDF
jgi:hypothetical protein